MKSTANPDLPSNPKPEIKTPQTASTTFVEQPIPLINSQSDLELYFSDAIFFQKNDICLKILETNFNNVRATVTTSINPTKSKSMISPFIGDVAHIHF